MADTVLDVLTDALMEIGVYASGEVPSAADATLALRKANEELDAWAARRMNAYSVAFTAYTLTPGHQPHLIGPGLTAPDFAADQRPVRIEAAALILNNVTPNVDVPLNIRDDDWWANQRVKGITTTVPTDLYYSPDYPNGSLWLWPVPSFAYGIRLETWGLISQLANLGDSFSLPPGYKKAFVLSLAERLCRPFGRGAMPDLAADASRARAAIQANNAGSPRIASADFGTRGNGRGAFNYYTGK